MSKAENMNEKLISYEVWKESIKQQNYCSYFQSKFWRVGRGPKIFLLFSKAAVKNQTCSRTTSTTPRILSLLQKKRNTLTKKRIACGNNKEPTKKCLIIEDTLRGSLPKSSQFESPHELKMMFLRSSRLESYSVCSLWDANAL